MPLVTKILKPADLAVALSIAVERSTLEALGMKVPEPRMDKKRLDRATRVLELLVAEGVLGVEPELGVTPEEASEPSEQL